MPDSNEKMIESEDLASAIPFQFDDVKVLAQKILRRAATQAQRKLDAAGEQAKDIEKAAYDDGYKKGHAEGYRKGEAEGSATGEKSAREAFEGRTHTVMPLLEALLGEIESRRQALRADAEADLLRLSLAIAEKIVRREIRVDESYILPTLHAAIGVSLERSDLFLRVHPEDHAAVEAELPVLQAAFTDLERLRVESDATLERGSLRLVGRQSEVDMRMEEQLAAFERALLGVEHVRESAADAAGPVARSAAPPPEAEERVPAVSEADKTENAARKPPEEAVEGPQEEATGETDPGEAPA